MKRRFKSILKVLAYGLFIFAVVFFLVLAIFPYPFLPTVTDVKQIPWTKENEETPKAVIQFTFTSKIAFTTNSPIHVKVDIPYFRKESINDTNLAIVIGNSQSIAKLTPLSQFPFSAVIPISTDSLPAMKEIDVEFTSQGSYGFLVFSGVLPFPELDNMTVAYIYGSELIKIEPFNVRYGIEIPVRGIGIASFFSCIVVYAQRDKIIRKVRKSRSIAKKQKRNKS